MSEFTYTIRMVEIISDYLKSNEGNLVSVFDCVFSLPDFAKQDPRAVLRLIDKVRNLHLDGIDSIEPLWAVMHRGCENHLIRAV